MPPVVRNPELRPWRTWYQLESWRRRRRLQLKQHPLCAECLCRGVVERATVADHTKPHHGDWNAFRLGDLQSLCDACHNSSKRRFDLDGYDSQLLDAQGWPLDPRHPANRYWPL